jgi:hypothetical protein
MPSEQHPPAQASANRHLVYDADLPTGFPFQLTPMSPFITGLHPGSSERARVDLGRSI